MQIRPVSRLLSAALLCAALAACSFDERIADHAVKYNKTVEETRNSLLLLNILRAKNRQPMHFTALTKVLGRLTLQSSGSLGLDIPFGGDAASTFPLSPSLTLTQTSSPSFDVVSLDSQEFMKGILSPIDKSIFKFYLDQRWPPEVLLHLFIHKVEQTEMVPTPINSPPPVRTPDEEESPTDKEKEDAFRNFQKWIEEVRSEIRFGTKKTGRAIGPKFQLTEQSVLEHLVEAEKAGLRLVGTGKKEPADYQLCKIVSAPVLCVGECPDSDPEGDCRGDTGKEPATSEYLLVKKAKKAKEAEKPEQTAHLRSVQGILYYLGEVLRYQEKSNNNIVVKCKDKARKVIDCSKDKEVNEKTVLFDLTTKKEEADTPIIGVEYNGQWYYVPKDKKVGEIEVNSRTKTVLALVSQLLGLHKSSKELPTTTAVETVGGSP